MVRKLPKNCKDWHPDLKRCAEFRANKRARLGKKDHNEWMKARDLLNASQDPIYIQPTGEYKVLFKFALKLHIAQHVFD